MTVLEDSPADLTAWAKSLYALEWLYLASIALPKMSIVFLYLRIFTDRGVRLICYALLAFVGAVWLSLTIASNFQCVPLAYQWNKMIPGGYCFDIGSYYKATSAPNIFSDIIMLVLPIPTIMKLQTTVLRKLGLLLVFLVGSV